MNVNEDINYKLAVQQMKTAILKSRYAAASLVNKELLKLYFGIGQYVSFHSRNKNWGKGAIDSVSSQLQQELHGLRGFSATNIRNMRIFYEAWDFMQAFLIDEKAPFFQFSEEELNRQLPSADLNISIHQLSTDELQNEFMGHFFKNGFTHHIAILNNTENIEERVFYIKKNSN